MMNELIPTEKDKQGNILVSGRDLHKFLEIGKDFSNWFKDMIKYGFEEGKDFTPFLAKNHGGRPRTEYAMTLDIFEEGIDFYKCTSSTVVNNGAVREIDDGQIVKHETEKDYDENPRTEIEVREWTK